MSSYIEQSLRLEYRQRSRVRIDLHIPPQLLQKLNKSVISRLNQAFKDCRPNIPLSVNIFAPDLCVRTGLVELVFVMGCVYQAPVPWSLRREKICECEMVEVQVGTSLYEMRHTCIHRELVELYPLSGIVSVFNFVFFSKIVILWAFVYFSQYNSFSAGKS